MSTEEPTGPPDPWQPPEGGSVPPPPAAPPPPPPPPMAGYPPAYPPGTPGAVSQGGYPAPPTGTARTSGKSTAVLLLGIGSLVLLCAVFVFLPISVVPAIIALALAPGAKREITQSGGALTGLGAVKAGVICSWVAIGISIAVVLLFVGLFALGSASESTFESTSDAVSQNGVGFVGLFVGMPVLAQVHKRLRPISQSTGKEN